MSQSVFAWASTISFTRPTCLKCDAKMLLVRIERSAPGVDQRTFECKCGETKTLLVQKQNQ